MSFNGFFQEQNYCNGVNIDDVLKQLTHCRDYDSEKMKTKYDHKSQVRYENKKCGLAIFTKRKLQRLEQYLFTLTQIPMINMLSNDTMSVELWLIRMTSLTAPRI